MDSLVVGLVCYLLLSIIKPTDMTRKEALALEIVLTEHCYEDKKGNLYSVSFVHKGKESYVRKRRVKNKRDIIVNGMNAAQIEAGL
tara:strand:- start:7360 stop:7617 length:258 start_codon:yes stop_codon:yes gene_type:complete